MITITKGEPAVFAVEFRNTPALAVCGTFTASAVLLYPNRTFAPLGVVFLILGVAFLMLYFRRAVRIDFPAGTVSVVQEGLSPLVATYRCEWRLDEVRGFRAAFAGVSSYPSPGWKQSLLMRLETGKEIELIYSILFPGNRLLEALEKAFDGRGYAVAFDRGNQTELERENRWMRWSIGFLIACFAAAAAVLAWAYWTLPGGN